MIAEWVGLELAKMLIWMLAGGLVTYIVMTVRRDRADAAREDTRVAEEFGPTLARWRSANEFARHLRPSWLPAATRSVWARMRSAARRGWVWLRSTADALLTRLRSAPALVPAVPAEAPPVWPPARQAARDVNEFTWPTNPAPSPLAAGRAPVELPDGLALDFAEEIRLRNAWLHREAQLRLADPDATGLLPAVRAEVAR